MDGIDYTSRSVLLFFFLKKICFHKTNLQKSHTHNTKHTICKSQEIQAKKKTRNIKRMEEKEMGVAKSYHNVEILLYKYIK